MIDVLKLYTAFIQKVEAKVNLLRLSNFHLLSIKPVFDYFDKNYENLTKDQLIKKSIFAQYYSATINDMINGICRIMSLPRGKDFDDCLKIKSDYIERMFKKETKKIEKNEYNFFNAFCILNFTIYLWKTNGKKQNEAMIQKVDVLNNKILSSIKKIKNDNFYKLIRFKNNKLENHQNFYENELIRTEKYEYFVSQWHNNFSSIQNYYSFNESISKIVYMIYDVYFNLEKIIELLNPFLTKLFDDLLTQKVKQIEKFFNNKDLEKCALDIFTSKQEQ